MSDKPEIRIVIERDYDNYFSVLVAGWVRTKMIANQPFRHHTIHVNSGPYRSSAMSYKSSEGELHLDFYSAIRNGFGGLSDSDVKSIIDIL